MVMPLVTCVQVSPMLVLTHNWFMLQAKMVEELAAFNFISVNCPPLCLRLQVVPPLVVFQIPLSVAATSVLWLKGDMIISSAIRLPMPAVMVDQLVPPSVD